MPKAMEIDADLLGQSPALAAVREQVKGLLQRVAFGRLPAILIEGETGTGKRLGTLREPEWVRQNLAGLET